MSNPDLTTCVCGRPYAEHDCDGHAQNELGILTCVVGHKAELQQLRAALSDLCADCFGAANRESAAALRDLNAQLDEAISRAVAAETVLDQLDRDSAADFAQLVPMFTGCGRCNRGSFYCQCSVAQRATHALKRELENTQHWWKKSIAEVDRTKARAERAEAHQMHTLRRLELEQDRALKLYKALQKISGEAEMADTCAWVTIAQSMRLLAEQAIAADDAAAEKGDADV